MSFQEDAAVQWGVNASLALAVEEGERVCVCTWMDVCLHTWVCMCVCVCVCAYLDACLCYCLGSWLSVCVSFNVPCACLCVYLARCVCTWVHWGPQMQMLCHQFSDSPISVPCGGPKAVGPFGFPRHQTPFLTILPSCSSRNADDPEVGVQLQRQLHRPPHLRLHALPAEDGAGTPEPAAG